MGNKPVFSLGYKPVELKGGGVINAKPIPFTEPKHAQIEALLQSLIEKIAPTTEPIEYICDFSMRVRRRKRSRISDEMNDHLVYLAECGARELRFTWSALKSYPFNETLEVIAQATPIQTVIAGASGSEGIIVVESEGIELKPGEIILKPVTIINCPVHGLKIAISGFPLSNPFHKWGNGLIKEMIWDKICASTAGFAPTVDES